MDFSREAPALVSAAQDIEKVMGLRAVGVACGNMITISSIADRAGVTSEAVRLRATGQRGLGDLPSPVLVTQPMRRSGIGGKSPPGWRPTGAIPESSGGHPRSCTPLCTADRVLAARNALLSEPDDAAREEFERLLQDA
jgi:hypothetical protein